MFMLIAIVSGVITHKKIFIDFFTFRWGKGQRSWLDAHNASGVLLLPFYAWAWWRTETTLREARDAGLLEHLVTNATRQEPGSAGRVANPARPLARLAAYETARQKQKSTSERCFLHLHCWRKRSR